MFMLYEKGVIKAFKRLLLGLMVGATAAQANLSFTLEGCRSTSIPSDYNLSANDFVCPDSAYTTGNLKGWAELDLVPHRVTIENKSKVPESFTFTVGGDYLKTLGGDLRGWDYISELVLDEDLSNQICKDWAYANQDKLVAQSLEFAIPGAGGVFSTIYRKISVNDPGAPHNGLSPGAKCVVNYVQRLAIGSSGYTGSSLQSNLWDEDLSGGEKRIQLPDVKSATVDKKMIGTQDQSHTWSIDKSGPASVNFGDTCAEETPLGENVDITISWTKHPAAPEGEILLVSTISMTNTASRPIGVSVSDQLYDQDGAIGGPELCGPVVIGSNYEGPVCVIEHQVDESYYDKGLRDTAIVSFSDPVYPDAPIAVELNASATVQFQDGNTLNGTAVVTDSESLNNSGMNVTFASNSFDPSGIGSYDNYSGGETTADINWTSVDLNESGSVVFHKTIYVNEAMIMNGSLRDTAVITSGSQVMDEDSHTVNFSTDATVSLTINKIMPDVLQEDEVIDVNFTVSRVGYKKNVTITFTAGEIEDSAVIQGLEPGTYMVTENAIVGFEPDSVTKQVTITLPSCGESVTFTNSLAGQPGVRAKKITYPAQIDSVDQNTGWKMTLFKKDTLGAWVEVNSSVTDTNGEIEFIPDGYLEEGEYKIEESFDGKDGWYQTGKTADCNFTVNYPEDLFRQDYVCTYSNTKYGKVIINKITDPVGMPDAFPFTQSVDDSGEFNLTDGTNKTFMNVKPDTYAVTEQDPTPQYDLVNLECQEYAAPNGTSTTTSGATATLNVDPGETVECTYTNRKRGMVEVLKYENGSLEYTTAWNFRVEKEVNSAWSSVATDSTPPALMDFGKAQLIPGDTYRVCELNAQGTWVNTWYMEGQPVTYYNPYYDPNQPENGVDNSIRCVDFSVESNQTIHFEVHNDFIPGGEPRTIGYWKNWTLCDGNGNQHITAAENGGFVEGYWLLDDVLAITLGETEFATCEEAVSILDKRDVKSGKKRAGDAAYALAAQLMAAKANYAAGAEQCQAATDAIAAGDVLLASLKFDGDGAYTRGKDAKDNAQKAHDIAGTLDDYNNDMLCP